MKRIKRTPAEKARAQYTGYLVKEPRMEASGWYVR